MKISLNIAGREFSVGAEKKGVATQLFVTGQDGEGSNSGAQMSSAYQQSVWVYACVSAIAEQVAQIPFRFSRTNETPGRSRRRSYGEDIVEAGPVVELFNRPHPQLTRFQFWELVISWLQLRGEFFAAPVMDGGRVRQLVVLTPDQMQEVVRNNALMGWRYSGMGQESPLEAQAFLPEELVNDRLANPYDFWRGMSPMTVARLAASTDYASAKFQHGLMMNNADTGVIVTTDQQPAEDQRAAILAALRERKRKAGTADRPLFLWGGAKVEKPTLSATDMQFLENRKFNRQEICAVFKVPQEIIGFTEDANRSVGESARLNFIENRILPLCERLEAALAPLIQKMDPTLQGWFDIECLPIMQTARRSRFQSAQQAFGLGTPIDVCNEIFDLGLPDDLPHAGKSFLPFSIQEVGAETEMPGEDDVEDQDEDSGSTMEDDEPNPAKRFERLLKQVQQRAPDTTVLWQSHVASRRKLVSLFKAKTGKVLNDHRRLVLEQLAKQDVAKAFAEQKGLVDLVFDPQKFGAQLNAVLTDPFKNTLTTAATELAQEIQMDDPWSMPPETALDFIASRKQPIDDVGGTVRARLNTQLQAGLEAGETTSQLSDRVRVVFNEMSEAEAKRVAQTEVNLAYNFSRHEAMTAAGIGYKAWLSSHGPTVRPAHANAEAFYIDAPIPLDEPFLVGGEELMYPGDPSGSLGNIINCQCIQLAARKKGEDAKSITFEIQGAGTRTFAKSPSGEIKAAMQSTCSCAANASARRHGGVAMAKI